MSFRRVENLHDASKITLNNSSIYRQRVLYIFDASWKYATIIQCHFGRVANVQDASKTCSFILDASRMNEHFLEA